MIQEYLKEYIQDLEAIYDTYLNLDLHLIKKISKVFNKFVSFFEISNEFRDLEYSLRILIHKLNSLKIDELINEQKEIFLEMLKAIGFDLNEWAKNVIFAPLAQDIHYMDASLLANIAQIDIMLQQ